MCNIAFHRSSPLSLKVCWNSCRFVSCPYLPNSPLLYLNKMWYFLAGFWLAGAYMLIDQKSTQTDNCWAWCCSLSWEGCEFGSFSSYQFSWNVCAFQMWYISVRFAQKRSRGPEAHVGEEQTSRTAWSPKLGFFRKSGLNYVYHVQRLLSKYNDLD